MKVDRNEAIAGVRLMKIRDFLRSYRDGFYPGGVAEYFRVEGQREKEIETALLQAGYIAYDEAEKAFTLTELGMQLSNAVFTARISRGRAEELVRNFLERVEAVNLRDELTHRVASVRVFGSYLSDAVDLGDLDLALALEPRRPSHVEESLERARKSGKSTRNYIEQLFYGQREVKRLLKERQPHISIHDYDEPDKLNV